MLERRVLLSGGLIFVVNTDAGSVGEYTTSGAMVNPSLISGLNDPSGIAVSGSLVPTFGNLSLPPSVLAGAKLNARVPVVITNQGNAIKGDVTINLFANTGTSLDGNQVLVT